MLIGLYSETYIAITHCGIKKGCKNHYFVNIYLFNAIYRRQFNNLKFDQITLINHSDHIIKLKLNF